MQKRLLSIAALALVVSPMTFAANLVQNGGFEADGVETTSPAGWLIHESGAQGGSQVVGSVIAPASSYAVAGPVSGRFFALLDAYNPTANVLIQSIEVPQVTQALLSFSMFVNDQSKDGILRIGAGLDFTSESPNRHARVDLLTAEASPLATDSQVLRSFYVGGATGRNFGDVSNDYANFSFDVTDLMANGGTFQLRFANVANDAALQVGIDNVSLNVTAVPEPSSWALMLAGVGLVGAVARRRIV
jgi:hypothetical protein